MTDATNIQQISPIFILAPTARNGITLIQRLLNSSKQIIIYGENYQLIENLPELVYANVAIHQHHAEHLDQIRNKFLGGNDDFWTSGLMPQTHEIMVLSFEWFYSLLRHYHDCSIRYGFNRWGIKSPMTGPQSFDRMAALLPNAQFIFIYRNLYDVIRSAKARQFISNSCQFAQYVTSWKNNITHVLSATNLRLLVIQYELLTSETDTWIGKIESFTNTSGIDRSVMTRRINTFTGSQDHGWSSTSYIKPAELSNGEIEVIRNEAGDLLDRFQYDNNPSHMAA